MKIGILLSSQGGSPLQGGIERGLANMGHRVEEYRRGVGFDLVLLFNQCAHTQDYRYPDFPDDGTPIAFIDSAEYGYFRRLPGVIGQYANAFAPGSMGHDTKNFGEQERLRQFLVGRSFPYFLREFSRYLQFPAGYHPIDYPLYHLSHCYERPDREEYLRRDLDLFVSWGASHPWRMQITEALRSCHTKCEIRVLNDQGGDLVHRMPQAEYFARTRSARCSVSFDGYGSGSFRMTEVLVRTLLLQGALSILTRAPLEDGVHCRHYGVEADGEKFLSTDVCEVLRSALADREGSFQIYERGYSHCMEHLTEEVTAAYVLEVVQAHDWGRATDLAVG